MEAKCYRFVCSEETAFLSWIGHIIVVTLTQYNYQLTAELYDQTLVIRLLSLELNLLQDLNEDNSHE